MAVTLGTKWITVSKQERSLNFLKYDDDNGIIKRFKWYYSTENDDDDNENLSTKCRK